MRDMRRFQVSAAEISAILAVIRGSTAIRLAPGLEPRVNDSRIFRVEFDRQPATAKLLCRETRCAGPSEGIDDHLTRCGQEIEEEFWERQRESRRMLDGIRAEVRL